MPRSPGEDCRDEAGLRARRASTLPIMLNDPLHLLKSRYGGINDTEPPQTDFAPMSPEPTKFKRHELALLHEENHELGEELEEYEQPEFQIGPVTGSGVVVADGLIATHDEVFEDDHSTSDNSEAVAEELLTPDIENPIDNSPYAQVRGAVVATDDLNLSINTPRMWILGILFSILGSATNLFFSLRFPSVTITPVIALLLVHPLGHLWDKALKRADDPEELFENGTLRRRNQARQARDDVSTCSPELARTTSNSTRNSLSWPRRARLWLAQGSWNEKEHACVYISSNVSFGFAFATDVIVEQSQFYHQTAPILYQTLLVLSTQILGYALAGVARHVLVRPSGMIWPATLVSTAMFTTLHREENHSADGWHISRWMFFVFIFLGSFGFYFLPGLLAPALSYFNVLTWLAPENVIVSNLFGTSSGLGLFPVTFDWNQIAYIGSPLVVPFWAAMNVVGGLVVVMWIIAPILCGYYYSTAINCRIDDWLDYFNVWYAAYMPILSASVFDNTGQPYVVSRILTEDFLFDKDAYQQYSRVFMPITYILSYALQFASFTAVLIHTLLFHGRDIFRQSQGTFAMKDRKYSQSYEPILGSNPSSPKKTRRWSSSSKVRRSSRPELEDLMDIEDVHNRLMKRYEDVPMVWYLLTGLITSAIGIFVVEYYPVHLPWYGLLLALGICAVLFIPTGIVMAITNQQCSTYLICQLACGALFPGRPVANMVFVTYGYITSMQGMKFSSDLKLGHYMKIPPRILFVVQLVATIISSLTQIAVLNWMLANVPGICTPAAINGFTCPLARVHFNGSILWGVVGPAQFFGRDAPYRSLIWAFLVGAIAPVFVWLMVRRKGPHAAFWRKVNIPVVFGSLSWIPPATGLNFSVWALVCYLFNYVIKRRRRQWWQKYNMTLSAALDSGVAFGVVVIFFGFVYPGFTKGFSWWGTEVYKQGCDWRACALKKVAPGEIFGPKQW